jgi:hypothetical protein
MTDYKIVCTDQEPINQPTTHAHIVAVGIDTDIDGYADDKQTKDEVIKNINSGLYRYYTVGPKTGKVAFVEVAYCVFCKGEIIRSKPDATTDNNLDSLRRCSWKS